MEPHVDLTVTDLARIEAEARRMRAEYFRLLMISAGRAIAGLFAGRAANRRTA